MKILQINCVFGEGSTGKIVNDLHTQLQKEGHISVVCYGRGTKHKQKNIYKVSLNIYSKFQKFISKITGVMYGGCFLSTAKLKSVIKNEKPDICHIHCINGNFVNIYRLIDWLKLRQVKTVVTLHAEFMHTANCTYAFDCEKWKTGCKKCPIFKSVTKSLFLNNTHYSWKRMKKAFENFDENLQIVSVSPWLMQRAQQSPILENKHHSVVLNGLDTTIFKRHEIDADALDLMELKGKKVILHVTACFSNDPDNIKGGYYIIELAKQLMEKENIIIVVAGSHENIDNLPPNIQLMGKISDQQKLARLYSIADVTVITSKRETFSMIVAESLCCGTPVVGFYAGAPEQIAMSEYSCFVEFGDVDNLAKSVKNMLDNDYNRQIVSQNAIEKYSKNRMFEDYMEIYEDLL